MREFRIINTVRRLLKGMAAAAAIAATAFMPAACTDDLLDGGDREYSANADGTYGPFDFTVSLDVGDNGQHTRASFNQQVKVENAWVAVFDSITGGLVTMMQKDFDGIIIEANSGQHITEDSRLKVKAENVNLMANDMGGKVFIAGVANYDGIQAMTSDGKTMPLIDALNAVTNIREYSRIMINTVSAEDAITSENKPLMSGFWGFKPVPTDPANDKGTGHGNFTIDENGRVHTNTTNYPGARIVDPVTKKITRELLDEIERCSIHLRRLYSKVNVTINVGSGFEEFSNPEVEICNMPQYTFINERTTVEDASKYSTESWRDVTPSAHFFGKNMNVAINSANPVYNSRNMGGTAAFYMDQSEGFTYDEKAKKITFSYWHYETKNWGLPSVKRQNDRGELFPGTVVFKSLCPDPEQDFNNNAPYIKIKADVKSASNSGFDGTYAGKAEFIVHEGYCCEPDGDANDVEDIKARDFSTNRNTNYTYTINLQGMKSIVTKVSKEDFSGADGYTGVGGEFYSTTRSNVTVDKGGRSIDITLPAGTFFWCMTQDGGEPFGVALEGENAGLFSSLYPTPVGAPDTSSTFYNIVTLDGEKLSDVRGFDNEGKHTLTFGSNSEVKGQLYLVAASTSADGTTKCYTVYVFDQDGTLLDTPVVTMPYTSVGELVIGINDHTIEWTEIEGAVSYTIKLSSPNGKGGYEVTLAPGQTISDKDFCGQADPTNITLTKDGNKLRFKFRYSNKAMAMMNLVTESDIRNTMIATVVANGDKNNHSAPGEVRKNVVNPCWDFNTNEWSDAVGKLPTATVDTWKGILKNTEMELNGLRLFTGNGDNSNKMEYNTFGSYKGFRPHGTMNVSDRSFRFHADAPNGKINVWACNAGTNAGSSARYMKLYLLDSSGQPTIERLSTKNVMENGYNQSEFAKLKTEDISTTGTASMPENEPNVFIANTGDFVIYKILFTPQDPAVN